MNIPPSLSDAASPTRRRGPRLTRSERREQLLEVTKQLAHERGFHAVSIEAVAAEAGVSRPLIYGHFEDLATLLEALIDREGLRALTQLSAVLPAELSGADPTQQLLLALRGYLEAVRSDAVTWRLVLMPPEGAPEALHDRIRRGRSAVVAQLAGAMSGNLPPQWQSPDPELTARMLSAFADESARLLLTAPERYPVERLLKHAAWALEMLRPGA